MNEVQKFRKKPVEIEAVQWDGKFETVLGFVTCECSVGDSFLNGRPSLFIPTLEGEMEAKVGWWIIKGVAGEFYPCAPDIFEATYEPVVPLPVQETKQ